MLNPQILSMIINKTLFMGTSHDNLPRVRPMRPFLDKDHNIWLISYADTEKIKELQNNKQVELCTINDNHDVLRIQGSVLMEQELNATEVALVRKEIFETVPNIAGFFTGAEDVNMVLCKLQIKNIILRMMEAVEKTELHFPPRD